MAEHALQDIVHVIAAEAVFIAASGFIPGAGAALSPSNLIDASRFELKTAQATVSLPPESSYLVEARIIDGKKYILIPAEEDVEVNGLAVRFPEEEKADA